MLRGEVNVKLRTRFVLVMGLFILALTGVVSVFAQRLFLRRAGWQEERMVLESVDRGLRLIDLRVRALGRLAALWAADAAAPKDEPSSRAATAAFMDDLQLEFAARFSMDGGLVWVDRAGASPGVEVLPPDSIWKTVLATPGLRLAPADGSSRSGWVRTGGELWMLALHPIVVGAGAAPEGALLLGARWTQDDAVALSIGSGGKLVAASDPAPSAAGADARVVVENENVFMTVGRGAVPALDGTKAATIVVSADRWLLAHGMSSLLYLNGLILISALAIGGFVFLFVDRLVLRHLTRSLGALRAGLRDVATGGTPGRRLSEGGADEMSELAGTINEMLVALESSQQEAVRRQRELIQSQKLAALGTLVAGVAHEVNNPNAVVAMNSGLLLRNLDRREGVPAGPKGDETRALVSEIQDASMRIAALVKSLKGFARPAPDDLTACVRMESVIEDSCLLLRHQFAAKTCELVMHLDPALPAVQGDAQQLSQVVVNLLQNACDASDRPGSRVTLRAAGDPDSRGVVLTVEDEGRGIAPEHVERVFEPFFTTRRDQGGSGLGLSISAAIVNAHGGRIRVESPPGCGARFIVWLPVLEEHPHDAPAR